LLHPDLHTTLAGALVQVSHFCVMAMLIFSQSFQLYQMQSKQQYKSRADEPCDIKQAKQKLLCMANCRDQTNVC